MAIRHLTSCALISLIFAAPALAEEAGDAAPEATEAVASKRSYTAADFARFAPRSALDMLRQIPGFTIAEPDQNSRGLGQATGNVLVNSERLSSKSDDIFTQLGRIPAGNVVRIDLVDAATLKVPGLTGVVANVISKSDSFSGQFNWSPQFRAHYAHPSWYDGSVSVTGKLGAAEYSLSLVNDTNRGAAGGPTIIRDAAGTVTETRHDEWAFDRDQPKLSGTLKFRGPGSSVGNLNASYQRVWESYDETGLRTPTTGTPRTRVVTSRAGGWNRELGGDFEFGLGPGRLKLIGLDRAAREPYWQSAVSIPSGGAAATGDRFEQIGKRAEHIARAEYSWKMLGGDWQAAGEAAFNRLETTATLGTLNPSGAFDIVPFPEAGGGVKEDRYEGSLSFSRPLAKNLTLQVIGAVERSTLAQTGPGGLVRSFVRPKGSLSLAWKPSKDFDINIKLRRQVGQLSFYDFLARVFLDNGNANTGNNQLRPRQDWNFEGEINKGLGPWGSTKVHWIFKETQDYVTLIPIGGGESVGNVPRARVRFIENVSTINLDPLGFKGAKINAQVFYQNASYKDPLGSGRIPFNNYTKLGIEANLRHDIPGSQIAWGVGIGHYEQSESYRLTEFGHQWEGPFWGSAFIEHKDVMGLTMRLQANNLLGARSYWDRTVFTGPRNTSPVLFTEHRDRLIGPIFTFQVKGSF
ncbi:MAG: TonB-dependent receptor [Novosphingobium sp.]